jgi:hypothetical protein
MITIVHHDRCLRRRYKKLAEESKLEHVPVPDKRAQHRGTLQACGAYQAKRDLNLTPPSSTELHSHETGSCNELALVKI